MTPKQLAEIKARVEAATPGPWEFETDSDIDGFSYVEWVEHIISKSVTIERYKHTYPGRQYQIIIASMTENETQGKEEFANATFIAHARQDVPALVAEVERLRGRIAEIEQNWRDVSKSKTFRLHYRETMELCADELADILNNE